MDQFISYLTMENILFFIGASIIFTIVLYLLKQVSKLLSFVVFCLVVYYFWVATPETKANMKMCVTDTVEKKEISPVCKKVF